MIKSAKVIKDYRIVQNFFEIISNLWQNISEMSKRGDNIQIRAKQECCETKKCPTKKQIPISEETIVSTNKLGDILLEEGGDVKKKIKEKVRFLADGKPYFNKKVISKTLKNKRR